MRVLYLTDANLALRRGHTKNIVKTVEALHAVGVPCTLGERLGITVLSRMRRDFDILYTRDHHLLLRAWFAKYVLRKRLVYEAHSTHGQNSLRRLMFSIADGVVFITAKLRRYYDPEMKKPSIVVHAMGSEPEAFYALPPVPVIRQKLGLPLGSFLILYIGSVEWYDLSVLIDMMPMLADDVVLVLGGVKEEEAERFRERARLAGIGERVLFPGRVSWEDYPTYLAAADVLVNPLAARLPGSISSKLYEYFAAGRPIISTLGGANDEILEDERNCLVADLTSESFSVAVRRVRKEHALAERISSQAKRDAARYTWETRARRIADFLLGL